MCEENRILFNMLSMDRTALLRRSVIQGFSVFSRERRWRSTFVMLCLVMLLLQLLIVAMLALSGIQQLLNAKAGFHVEVVQGATSQGIQELYAALKELPYVEQVTYIPKEKAYEMEKLRDPALVQSLENFALANPFPDTFSVVLTSLNSFEAFVGFINQPAWKGVVGPSFQTSAAVQQQQMGNYVAVSRSVTSLAWMVLWIALAALLGIIVDLAVRRTEERREELDMQRAMGASAAQILLPFTAEIGALLIVALIAGFIGTFFLLFSLPLLIPALATGGALAEARAYIMPLLLIVFPLIALMEVVLLPCIGLLGAVIALKSWSPYRIRA